MTVDTPELRLLQLTDTHLYGRVGDTLKGVDTAASLRFVLEHTRAQMASADALLATGDIAQDRSPEAYRAFRSLLDGAGLPVFCIPGNHDDPPTMRAELDGDGFHYCHTVEAGGWVLPMLETCDGDRGGGRLGAGELERLDAVLRAHADRHALVVLHHHPVPSGTPWLDTVGLDDAESFLEIIDAHDNVRGVLWGHVHQHYDEDRGGVRMMGTPSTCFQFARGGNTSKVDGLGPGFRWLELYADGTIRSEAFCLDVPPAP